MHVCVGSFLLSAGLLHVSSRVRIAFFFNFPLPQLHFLAEKFESASTMEVLYCLLFGFLVGFLFFFNYVYIFLSKAVKSTGMFLPYI